MPTESAQTSSSLETFPHNSQGPPPVRRMLGKLRRKLFPEFLQKVVWQAEQYRLPPFNFMREEKYSKAALLAPKTLRQMNRDDKVRACHQHCTLRCLSNEAMSNKLLRGRFQVPEGIYSIASRIIADKIEAKLIKPADSTNRSKKRIRYVPVGA